MGHKRIYALLAGIIGGGILLSTPALAAEVITTQSDIVTIFAPSDDINLWDPGVSYPRVMEVQHNGSANGTLLSTFEMYNSACSMERPGYPLYRSTDSGASWNYVTTVRETAAAVQSEWQMHLFELPCQLGDMREGTLLLAAVSVDSGHARTSIIRLYRSFDVGETWEEYSTVATGGGLKTGVWEPFLMMLDDGRIVCYYSDSTDCDNHSQMLSYCVSPDGVNWGEPVHFVALEDRTLRPGMATVCRLNNGKYFMTYEICIEDKSGAPVYYRFSDDGLNWGNPTDKGTALRTMQYLPGSAPCCAYVPGVGDNGLIVVRATYQTPGAPTGVGTYLFVNDNGGEGSWETMDQPLPYKDGGYSSFMFLSSDASTLYMVNGVNNDESELDYHKIVFTKLIFEKTGIAAEAVASTATTSTVSTENAAAVNNSSSTSADDTVITDGGSGDSNRLVSVIILGVVLLGGAAVVLFVFKNKKSNILPKFPQK